MTVPTVNVDSVHTRNPLGLAASIEAVWGVGGTYTTNRNIYDPAVFANAQRLLPIKNRIGVWYATLDTVVLPADVTDWAAFADVKDLHPVVAGHGVSAPMIFEPVDWLINKIIAEADQGFA
jgi:hypothetical protein